MERYAFGERVGNSEDHCAGKNADHALLCVQRAGNSGRTCKGCYGR